MTMIERPQRGRRSAGKVPVSKATRKIRFMQRMYYERIAEVGLVVGIFSGLATLVMIPVLFTDSVSWGLPIFGASAVVLGLSILSYVRAHARITAIDDLEVKEHKEWSKTLRESLEDIDWDAEMPRDEALRQLSQESS